MLDPSLTKGNRLKNKPKAGTQPQRRHPPKRKRGAGLFRTSPFPLKTKIGGIKHKADYRDSGAKKSRALPAGDKTFVGHRWKDARFTLARNREEKEAELVI